MSSRSMKNRLLAYTDGSTFRTNPGPISWAVVFVRNNRVVRLANDQPRILTGAHDHGTNNRAELMAVIWALEHETTENLVIVTDSLLTLRCATGEWRRSANLDLWERYQSAVERRERRGLTTSFRWVRGHHNDRFNRMADKLASAHAKDNFASIEDDNDVKTVFDAAMPV